jgi:hypothetical protein
MKLYEIEYRSDFYGTNYRWRSKYNAAHGAWCTIDQAKRGGEDHQKIIIMIHGGPLASILTPQTILAEREKKEGE